MLPSSLARTSHVFRALVCRVLLCQLALTLGITFAALVPQLGHAAQAAAGNVDDQRIKRSSEEEPGSWLTYGQTYKEQRFSTLARITPDNINTLGLAWSKPIGGNRERMEATPLIVDGVMYVTSGWNVVYALNARTGEEIWSYDPKTDRQFVQYSCCGGVVNRGVAVYQGRVYVGTNDGRLVALDAASGKLSWEVDTYDETALGRFNITGAPRAAAGKVFIGQGSSENGRRRGYVTAYDADTGKQGWRFYIVPGDPSKPFEHPEMELAAKTWNGEWWKKGGGGTAWNSLVYDEELETLYIGVGNGAPWPRTIRAPGGGDNLFLSSIIAVDVNTARMKWYYQTTPGDNWDYSSAMDMVLGELNVDGKPTKVLMQAPKNGFFYVIDRTNGKLLRAHPYTEQINWATHVDMATGRPVETPVSNYDKAGAWIIPANGGAHNWEPMSWDQRIGIMYFYYHDMPNFYSLDETFVKTGNYDMNATGLSLGTGYGPYRQALQEKAGPEPKTQAYLVAFDPLSGKNRWKLELEAASNGGVLATTSGLLFQGEGNGKLSVRSVKDGSKLWEYNAYGMIHAPVITYEIDDEQYIATLRSGNLPYAAPGEVLVFKLNGKATLPEPPKRNLLVPEQPPLTADAQTVDQGNALYHQHCANCHRGLGVPSIVATAEPDLRMMTAQTHEAFLAIVLGGMKRDLGMRSFANELTAEDANAIHQFLISEAIKARTAQQAAAANKPTPAQPEPRG